MLQGFLVDIRSNFDAKNKALEANIKKRRVIHWPPCADTVKDGTSLAELREKNQAANDAAFLPLWKMTPASPAFCHSYLLTLNIIDSAP